MWIIIAVAAVALPFLAGGIALGYQAAVLPDAAGRLALARLLGSALFSFGFAIALVSSVVALLVDNTDRRALGAAGLLLGCSHIALGFVVRRSIEGSATNFDLSLAPVALPLLLWAASVWFALRSTKLPPDESKTEGAAESSTEEQPQLLSPP